MKNLIPWLKRKNEVKNYKENSIANFHKEINSLFDRFFETGSLLSRDFSGNIFGEGYWMPKIDVSEGKKDITVKAEIPGIDAKDLDISIDGRRLTIKGEKKHEQETKKENYHHLESSYGYFNRTIELPADVIESEINASYKNGILKIEMKKTKETESKTIKVKTEL
ncbi:MAG: Hsp20/alpha crystallin family protein [Desulfobacterales bacterium]|nr:Hsp20/alpha crystallin family protein [Desulfobacterales bacterium]MBF0397656.1 Hsp20/alpha crystallin family protein [Desulfobacterales bacterium]